MSRGIIIQIQKNQILTEEKKLISRQCNKGEKLRLILQYVQEEALDLKHNYDQWLRSIKSLQSSNQLRKSIELVRTQNTEVISILKNFEQLQQRKLDSIIHNLQIIENTEHQQFQKCMSASEQQLLTDMEKCLDKKISFFLSQIRSIKRKIEQINQQIHKRRKSSNASQKLMNFVGELKIIFQDNVSDQEIYELQKMNFNQVTLTINEQIVRLRGQIDSLRRAIIQFKDGCILTDIQLRTQGNTAQQLEKLQNQHNRLNQELSQITKNNQNLQSNMQQQVSNIVDQKINSIDLESYQHVNKYLIASQCVLNKFGAILPKQELGQFIAQLQQSFRSANQKFNQNI